MGQTLYAWCAKVAGLIRDEAGKDQRLDEIETVGLRPAFAQFSTDRPYRQVVETPGAGSPYFDMPAGWVEGESAITDVEFPARQNPPLRLDDQSWRVVGKITNPAVKQLLLLGATPVTGQYVWVTFTSPWPYPDIDADDDKVSDLGFEAVSALAACFCLTSLAAEAAKGRAASLPTNHVDGTGRARTLMDAANRYENVYNRFLGMVAGEGSDGRSAVSSAAPAHGTYDLDPSYASLYHGGRR